MPAESVQQVKRAADAAFTGIRNEERANSTLIEHSLSAPLFFAFTKLVDAAVIVANTMRARFILEHGVELAREYISTTATDTMDEDRKRRTAERRARRGHETGAEGPAATAGD